MEHADILALLIGAVVVIFNICFCFYTGQKQKIRDYAISLVIKAELKYGSGTGEIKYTYVVKRVKAFIPNKLVPFISDKIIDQFIDDGLYIIKDMLDDGKLNKSVLK